MYQLQKTGYRGKKMDNTDELRLELNDKINRRDCFKDNQNCCIKKV